MVAGGGTAYAAGELAKNSVTSKVIKNGAVKKGDLGTGAVTTKKLANGAVTVTKLANGAVTVTKLANGAVTVTKLGDGSVTGAKIADAEVTAAKIADGSVTGAKIADGQVAGADIADQAIGASKLDPATVGDVISAGGTLPNTGTSTDILTVAGFGVLRASCAAGGNLGMFFALNSPVQQKARVFGHDPTDNAPQGTASLTNTAGGVGYSGPGHALLAGEVRTFTAERVLTLDLWVDPACAYSVHATLDRNETP